jgi:prephenate dehydrogenase
MFQEITILGPGLLGASLAMAVKAHGLAPRVHAWSRRAETRAQCLQTDWCDAVFETPEAAVRNSDLVVICTPVETIVPLLSQIEGKLKPGALITDVGSTKAVICREASRALLSGSTFIGSHPMAGSERTGMAHARADLFNGACCLITPTVGTDPAATEQIAAFWQALQMRLATVSPEQHDEIVAHISHLPHLLASSLCGYLAEKDSKWATFAGAGLRDSTRIAAGDPSLWQQILQQNRTELLKAIAGFERELDQIKNALLCDDSAAITAQLAKGKAFRDRL